MNDLRKVILISTILVFSTLLKTYAQNIQKDSLAISYKSTFLELQQILENNQPNSFKKAVFLIENTYLHNHLNEEEFNRQIYKLTTLINEWKKSNPLSNYNLSDSINVHTNYSIYKILKDTTKVQVTKSTQLYLIPYTYDFTDYLGQENWSNMFVSKLLATHKGNCHSLPYLYKILADESEATCWLSFAPNHIYIKNRCKKIGWYNTELTSGDFPIDAWILTSGYIPVDAVRSGIYMDTLSNQQALAQTVLDLAKGYEFQTKNYTDGFILKCCDLTLQYHPQNVQALLLKAETYKRIFENHGKIKSAIGLDTYAEMEKMYIHLFELGYREMPEKMYMQWLRSVTKERNKYTNKALKATLSKH